MPGNSPPLIYMNMHAGTSDADANSTPQWVWLMLAGVVMLAGFGLAMWWIASTGI